MVSAKAENNSPLKKNFNYVTNRVRLTRRFIHLITEDMHSGTLKLEETLEVFINLNSKFAWYCLTLYCFEGFKKNERELKKYYYLTHCLSNVNSDRMYNQ